MAYVWCNECKTFKNGGKEHDSHELVTLGESTGATIQCLDDLIQIGQDRLAEMQSDLENARRVDGEINDTREKFKNTLLTRIEKIVKDLRVALDEHSMELLGDVERNVADMSTKAQTVIRTSRMKLDTANAFLRKAAVTLPNDDGKFDDNQLKEVYNHFQALEKVNKQPKPDVKSVNVNIKFPNTMKMKLQCRQLSKQIIGEIEDSKRPGLLNAQRPSVDVASLDDFSTLDMGKH